MCRQPHLPLVILFIHRFSTNECHFKWVYNFVLSHIKAVLGHIWMHVAFSLHLLALCISNESPIWAPLTHREASTEHFSRICRVEVHSNSGPWALFHGYPENHFNLSPLALLSCDVSASIIGFWNVYGEFFHCLESIWLPSTHISQPWCFP